MKILLLGATGLLGHNVLRQLLIDGHQVVALARTPKKVLIEHPMLTIVEGNLSLDSIESAACGCNAIVNCAGVTDMSLLRIDDYLDINAHLNERLVRAMERLGITTLVHTSTANTIGYGDKHRLANETDPIAAPFDKSFYALSKLEGEHTLEKAARTHPDWHIVTVNPGFMIGDYDLKPSSGVLLLAGFRKRIMAAPKGGKSFVAAKDAAKAIANALTLGSNGQTYLLTGSNMSLRDLYALQASTMGYRQTFIDLPNWMVSIAGRLGDLLRMCHIKTQLSTRNVRQLMVMEYYDNQKAIRELQMPQTPIHEAIKDFFDWWNNNNGEKAL